jgi:hypothetical protein
MDAARFSVVNDVRSKAGMKLRVTKQAADQHHPVAELAKSFDSMLVLSTASSFGSETCFTGTNVLPLVAYSPVVASPAVDMSLEIALR